MGYLKSPLMRGSALFLERFAYRMASSIVVLSHDMAEHVVNMGATYSKKVRVITNGSDTCRFRPDCDARRSFRQQHSLSEEKIVVLYAGAFGLVNDAAYLVDLAFELKDDDRFIFLAAGTGSELAKVQQRAMELALCDDKIRFLGALPKEKISEVFSGSDISLSLVADIPARAANSANKFFDSLASGCCVAINYGGWQENLLCSHGAGIKLSRDVEIAAKQLTNLVQDKKTFARAKVLARRLALMNFSWSSLAAETEKVIQATNSALDVQRRR
jgi:glycosyltransferase involved in cell wall biosynthesis